MAGAVSSMLGQLAAAEQKHGELDLVNMPLLNAKPLVRDLQVNGTIRKS